VLLEAYGGDWNSYCDALYQFFHEDFIASQATYHGMRVAIKRHPLLKGKEATFWHLISEGDVEDERLPDLRRCERIRWPRPIIDASSGDKVRFWRARRGEERVVIAVGDFSYVVVLAIRRGYVVLWTAYYVEREHRRRKLRAECDEYWQEQKKS